MLWYFGIEFPKCLEYNIIQLNQMVSFMLKLGSLVSFVSSVVLSLPLSLSLSRSLPISLLLSLSCFPYHSGTHHPSRSHAALIFLYCNQFRAEMGMWSNKSVPSHFSIVKLRSKCFDRIHPGTKTTHNDDDTSQKELCSFY